MRKITLIKNNLSTLFLTLALFATTLSFSQTRTDDCGFTGGAEIIPGATCVNIPWNSSTAGNYWSAGTPSCGEDINRDDVWGWFEALSTSTTVSYSPVANRNAILTLFSEDVSGCSNNMPLVGCSNVGGNGVVETVVLTTTVNSRYMFRVQRDGSNNSMSGNVCVFNTPTPPANDDCANAIALPVGTACSYSTYTTENATDSGEGAPTCGTPAAPNDVWFTAVFPASGELNIDTQANVVTDGVMEVYLGSCGAFTTTICDDDSGTGTMPTLVLTGTPGATVTIRFWEYGSNNDGTFGICAWDPNPSTPCVTPTTQPTALTFSGVTTTQIDGSFTAAGAPGADNYLVVMNTTNVAPTLVDGTTYNPGDAIAGGNTVIDNDANTTFTAAGLTDSTTYYFFVFSYNNTACSGGPLYNTTGPLNNSQATVTPTPCVTPATQPTALTFGTVTGSTIAATFTAAVPAVDNYLVVYNTTNVAPTLTNGTSYNPGDTIGASTVVDNDADTSFLASGLTSTTTYYFFVFAFNDSTCAGGPLYNTTAPLNGTETTVAFTYCEPSNTENRFYINDFSTVGNVTDITNLNTGYTGTGYTDYTAQVVTNLQGATVNFVADFGQANNTFGASIWVDFNSDSTFDPGEQVYTSGAYVGGVTASFIIPPATPAGSYRMRLLIDWLDTTPDPCLFSADRGEAEDYTLTVTSPAPCTTPIAQPTALSFDSVTASAITASFTAAAPAADNYLVVMNTTGVAPTIVDGTTYLVGDTIGTSTVIDTDSDTIFTATPLLPTTTYFFFIYSYNNLICSGGPLYNTVLPLLGNTITPVASAYCEGEATVDESVKYINDLEFIGTLNDVSNFGNGFTGGATPGYQDWTGLTNSIQAQGEGINVFVEGEIGRGHIKAWVDWDRNGAFDFVTEEVYDSEGIATTSTTFGFVIPPAQAIGDYRIRIRYYNSFRNSDGAEYAAYDFDACEDFGPQVHFGFNFTEYGETEDYLFTVISSCDATIDNIVEPSICGDGTANLAATGSASTIEYHWYANEGDTVPIVTTNVGNWTTPVLTTSTDYYVTADNGTCESLVKTKISVRVNPVAVLTFTPSTPEVCGEDDIIAISAAGTNEIAYLIEEDFETGTLGTLVVNNLRTYTAAETAITQWQPRTSTFVPAEAVWFPAISSGFGTNNFAMANSDSSTTNITETAIESGVLDSSTFTDLTLDFDMYFSRYVFGAGIPENVNVEVSTNGGGAWTTLQTYDNDIGYGTAFASQTIDLSAYVNETNLKVRIRYFADYWCDGVAIDNVELYGSRPLNSSFSWTSPTPIDAYTDPAATIPYTTGTTVGIVYVKPTAVQLEQNSFEFVATATMNNGCEISANIAITNNTKFWKGTTDTEWNDPTNWAPAGVPTIDNCVIIPDNTEITGTGYDAYARNLTVRPTGVLDLQSENNLTVQEFVTVDAGGTFDIRDSASLIQIDNDANTGTVTIERNSQAMNALDYTFWSSPITAYTLGGLVPGSLYYLSYTPTIANGHGNWNYLNAGDSMAPGTGYAIRSTGTGVHNGSFVGTPTNGDVNTAITIGTDATLGLTIGDTTVGPNDDQWQLIGNPYASAIDITTFLNHPTNSPILDGTAYLWTHNTAPTAGTPDPFYADYVANYTLNDYASINSLGGTTTAMSGGTTPIAYIASGQSFVVLGTGNGTAIFDNTMRGSNNNNTFFKTAEQQNSKSITPDFEKHRVWFNLSSDYGGFSQVLLGYAEGATNGWDRGLDAINYGGNSVTFYFVTPDIEMKTQAKPLPFADTDIVPLGYKAVNQGQLRIGIDHFDDLFDTIDIYVRDKDLDVEHNLKLAPYIFTTEVGVFNDRFEIIYRSNALSTTDFDSVNNNVLVFSNGDLTIKSNNFDIKNVQVFNTLGQKLFNLNNINKTLVSLNGFRKTETMLLITIELSNGATLTKKVIH